MFKGTSVKRPMAIWSRCKAPISNNNMTPRKVVYTLSLFYFQKLEIIIITIKRIHIYIYRKETCGRRVSAWHDRFLFRNSHSPSPKRLAIFGRTTYSNNTHTHSHYIYYIFVYYTVYRIRASRSVIHAVARIVFISATWSRRTSSASATPFVLCVLWRRRIFSFWCCCCCKKRAVYKSTFSYITIIFF